MPTVFVSPDWLTEHRDDVAIVDVREPWKYAEGHIPGAVNIPFDGFRDPTDDIPGKLPTADSFGTLLGDAGISSADHLVAYDDDFGVYASRFLITAEIFGHDVRCLGILDGDFNTWEDRYDPTTEPPSVDPRNYECEWADSNPLITASELDAALDTNATIVDTRDPIEYDTVHIPGAVNFQWQELVDESSRQLKARNRCQEILIDHGITIDNPVRLYCNTARRLSFVYAALRELGYDDVAFYEGGIDAWADYGGTVETT